MDEKKEIVVLNIFHRMAKVTEKLGFVKKGLTIEVTKEKSYKAVSEGDVLASVKPLEIEYGIYSYPISRTITETGTITNKYGTVSQFMRIETIYRFVNVDKPEEWIEVTTYGDGIDSGDKAPGKAMTYADKYALLKAYKIETGDDPDAEASGEYESKGKIEKKTNPEFATSEQIDVLKKNFKDAFGKLLEMNNIPDETLIPYEFAVKKIDALREIARQKQAKNANAE